MLQTDEQAVAALVASARWSDEAHCLRDFVSKNRLPALVKIIKGQYSGIGVGTLPNPCMQSTALLLSTGRARKILAQTIKVKEGRRMVDVGPKFIIPDTYQGYFELLSEDGRPTRCVESVAELAVAHRKSDCAWLVRDSVRAIVGRYDEGGQLSADGARIINMGESLFPQTEVHLASAKSKFLRCVDSIGNIVLLSMDQRGRFSMLAKEDNISGVHTAKNLLQKRLPICVRLVHGTPPSGFKNSSQFVPEMRLLCTFEEDHLFAMPLNKDTNTLILLPLIASIKLQRASNEDTLKDGRAFQRLIEKCDKLAIDHANRAFLLDSKSIDSKVIKNLTSSNTCSLFQTTSGYPLSRSLSAEAAGENRALSSEYDEIDLIYDYVRGFAPLPKNVYSPFSDLEQTKIGEVGHKPKLPPIETIPKTRVPNSISSKAEKRAHRPTKQAVEEQDQSGYSKLYIKNGSSHTRRLLRQKSCSPLKEPTAIFKLGSPIFNIRYKSLNNLHQAIDIDGTLNSSTSGGKTSSDSITAATTPMNREPIITLITKLPEKRSKCIERPRSLTNLVWESHPGNQIDQSSKFVRTEYKPSSRREFSQSNITENPKRIGTLYL